MWNRDCFRPAFFFNKEMSFMNKQDNVVVIHVAKFLDGHDRLCNHDCIFCIERMEPGSSNDKLASVIEIDSALSNYVNIKGNIDRIYIAGGEPTLRKDFEQIVKIAQNYCSNIILSTNCDFDNPGMIDVIVDKLHLQAVATSVHSHLPEMHDKMTKCSGSFFRTISTVRQLIDRGVDVTVNSVISSFNVTEMEHIVEFFHKVDLKIKKLTLTHYMNHGNAFYHNELIFDVDMYNSYINKAIDRIKNVDYCVTFRDFPICLDLRLEDYQENVEYIDVLNLSSESFGIASEKAPSFTKEKCNNCFLFCKCPHYLLANYGKERYDD